MALGIDFQKGFDAFWVAKRSQVGSKIVPEIDPGRVLGGPGESWGGLGGQDRKTRGGIRNLEPSWGRLGGLLGLSWGPFRAVLGLSWAVLEPSWGRLGGLLGRYGAILETSWALLGPSWSPLGPLLGLSGAILGPCRRLKSPSEAKKRKGKKHMFP